MRILAHSFPSDKKDLHDHSFISSAVGVDVCPHSISNSMSLPYWRNRALFFIELFLQCFKVKYKAMLFYKALKLDTILIAFHSCTFYCVFCFSPNVMRYRWRNIFSSQCKWSSVYISTPQDKNVSQRISFWFEFLGFC